MKLLRFERRPFIGKLVRKGSLVVHILREASTFRAKALHREVSEEGLETSKFYLYFSRS